MGRIRRRLVRDAGPAAPRRTIPVAAAPAPEPRWSACYAPHASIYFDQHGKARACCQNTGVYLGDVTTQTVREIWESADAEQMRTALEHDDYSAGCEFCEWQVREGNTDILFARGFDHLRPAERRPAWPRMMEFSLTNTCNLQCAMCNGDWSSTIRAKREGRAPLPAVYGDAFYEQLAEFLPHLEEVAFLGGEPFLGREPLRVMEMLAELEAPPQITITTNGTVHTARVARIIAALRPNIVVSIDGASTETYDAIRVGAHLPDVLANLDRFRDELGPGKVSITTCLMTGNWHEFADLLALAEERDLVVGVNVVRFPEAQSLYQLPADELDAVVTAMQATEVSLTGVRLAAWKGHVAALAHRLDVVRADHPELGPAHGLPGAPGTVGVTINGTGGDDAAAEAEPSSRWPWLPFAEQAEPDADRGRAVAPPAGPVTVLDIDTDGRIAVAHHDPGLAVDLGDLHGGHVDALSNRLEDAIGPVPHWSRPRRHQPDVLVIRPGGPEGPGPLEVVVTARRDDAGTLVGGEFRFQPAGPA
jgi:MoaA/NifB/PqqE/SkfB family radical SAM enzyme